MFRTSYVNLRNIGKEENLSAPDIAQSYLLRYHCYAHQGDNKWWLHVVKACSDMIIKQEPCIK